MPSTTTRTRKTAKQKAWDAHKKSDPRRIRAAERRAARAAEPIIDSFIAAMAAARRPR